MEKQLKCVLLLSLKEMALRNLASVLWSGSDILAFISKFRYRTRFEGDDRIEWLEILQPKIKDKVSKLGLLELLAKKMIDLVRPIGFEISRWKEFHEGRYQSLRIGLPGSTKLCWTTVGRIDYRRTAEELVRCEEISVVQRYEIACDYCLEDFISLLWEELPGEKKDNFYEKIPRYFLQFCWPHILKGELSKLNYLLTSEDRNLTSFNQWAFEQSARQGFKSAAEHFFQKLTHEERETSFMRSAHDLLEHLDVEILSDEDTFDTTYYLLTLMTPEEQMETIKAHPIDVLLSFLRWQLQDLFSENSSLIWTYITPSDYDELIWKVVPIFQESALYLPKLFQEFFIRSPLAFRKECVYRDSFLMYHFLSTFIESEDSESIEVIFRNVDAADRVELVCHPRCLKLFHDKILSDRWHMVEVFLREAVLSRVDRKRLEKAFVGFLRQNQSNWEDPMFKKIFKFLDDTYESADKQKKARKHKLCPE